MSKKLLLRLCCLLSLFLFGNCSSSSYHFIAIVDDMRPGKSIGDYAKIYLRGLEVGYVADYTRLDSTKVLLNMVIDKKINVHRTDEIRVRENLLGGGDIEIIPAAGGSGAVAMNKDTLMGHYVPQQMRTLDSASKERVMNDLKDLKKVLDTVIAKKE